MRSSALASALASAATVSLLAACVGDDPAVSAQANDAGADAMAPDVEAPLDGGDAGAPLGFCEKNGAAHDFCADFDRVARAGEGWTVAEVRGASEAPSLGDVASSPPHSMRSVVHYTAAQGADVPISRLSYQKPFATPNQHPALHVELALFVEKADERNVFFTNIEMARGVGLALRKPSADAGTQDALEVLVLEGPDVVGIMAQPVRLGEWTRIAVTVAPRQAGADGGAAGGGYTVEVGAEAKTFALTPELLPQSFRADIGLAVSNKTGAEWTAYFDDVLIDGAR